MNFEISNEISDAATEAAQEHHAVGCPCHSASEISDYCSCGAQESHEDAVRRFIAAMDEAGLVFALVARESA